MLAAQGMPLPSFSSMESMLLEHSEYAPSSSAVIPTQPSFLSIENLSTLASINAVANFSVDKLPGVNKRVYYCQRCLNHNRLEPRKNHKSECVYSLCSCSKCILVEKRRVLNTQLHELEESEGGKKEKGSASGSDELSIEGEMILDDIDDSPPRSPSAPRKKGERVPNCQKCGQHGKKSRLKGHKRVCPYRDCNCPKCQVVTERQKLMADQIKIRRRQRKDTIMNLTRENLTATLNAAAAFSAAAAAGNLPPGFDLPHPISALLLSQLKGNGGLSGVLPPSSLPSSILPPPPVSPVSPESNTSASSTTSTVAAPQPLYPFSPDFLLKQSSLLFNHLPGPISPTSPSSSTPTSISLSTALDSVLAATRPMTVGAGSPSASSTTPSPAPSTGAPLSSSPGLIVPVPINPMTSSPTSLAFPFSPMLPTDPLLIQQLLASYKGFLEQQQKDSALDESPSTPSNGIIDVCSV